VLFPSGQFGFALDHAQVIPLKVVIGNVVPFQTGIVPNAPDTGGEISG
jgi:hypothetical protein